MQPLLASLGAAWPTRHTRRAATSTALHPPLYIDGQGSTGLPNPPRPTHVPHARTARPSL
eukprot:3935010-Rhodomonas_salina.3